MQQDFENVEIVYPSSLEIGTAVQQKPDIPFSDIVIEYLDVLSYKLMKDIRTRHFPDVATFAFFCRKANLKLLKTDYLNQGFRLGRGVIFHIAPSNVPINFAYSLVCGLLSGNSNIVRLPSKEFEQIQIIVETIRELSQIYVYKMVSDRIALIRYAHNSAITNTLSSLCHVRIIWGGDNTIAQIRKSDLPARSFDVTFADRYSFCVINADQYIQEQNQIKIAEAFYNDTYLFDQNACSAPHLVVWLGEQNNVRWAQEIFWGNLYDIVVQRYTMATVLAVDKLTSFYRQAVAMKVEKEQSGNNLLWRVKLCELLAGIDEYRCAAGYFSEYITISLDELIPIIKNKYQTMAYYGIPKESLQRFVVENGLSGIDRIVPIGKTTDFSIVWDGYDLMTTLSRRIS